MANPPLTSGIIIQARGTPIAVPSDGIGIVNDAGTLKQQAPDGTLSALGGGGGAITVTAGTGLTGVGTVGSPLAGIPSSASVPGTMSAADYSKLLAIPTVQRVRVELGGSATVITVPGLDSDTYGDYKFYLELKFSTAAVFNAMTLQVNADTGNAASEIVFGIDNAASASQGTGLSLGVPNTTTAGTIMQVRGTIRCKKNAGNRFFECTSYYVENTTRNQVRVAGRYTVVNTNVTSLVFASNQASSLLTGSYAEVESIPAIT